MTRSIVMASSVRTIFDRKVFNFHKVKADRRASLAMTKLIVPVS
jgi:hypothetical protein